MVDLIINPCINIKGEIGVVIDVLRATSTIVAALANGAKSIKPVETVEEALKYKNRQTLICGERKAKKPEKFDLGNSPLEFTKDKVYNKKIVLTTTNGTGVMKFVQCKEVIAASFLNFSAVIKYLKNKKDIIIVCSGTEEKFSIEDFLLAGAIINNLDKYNLKNGAYVAMNYFKTVKNIKEEITKHSSHAQYLCKTGFKEDVDFCLTMDYYNIIPVKKGDLFFVK